MKESLKTECIVALADLDGEFLASEPVYRDARWVRFEEDSLSAGELHAIRQQLEEAHHQLEVAAAREEELQGTLEECELQATETCDSLRTQLATEKEKARTSWRTSCEHLEQQDIVITAQDRKIAYLRERITELEAASNELMKVPSQKVQSSEQAGTVTTSVTAQSYPRQVGRSLLPPTTSHSVRSSLQDGPPHPDTTLEGTTREPDASLESVASAETIAQSTATNTQRRGRAPPIEFFTGEDPSITVDDWLPSLERASDWNSWTAAEKLMQLPGHLKGRALQEWRLLEQTVQQDYRTAIEALRSRLDPGSKTMAAQDFRHSIQRSGESVPDYIRRLEKTYQIAYGKDDLNSATRDTLLYGQLYKGLSYDLMQSPAVSGAQHYQGLCTAAKGEERRLAALKQRRNFKTTVVIQPATCTPRTPDFKPKPPWTPSPSKGQGQSQRVCFKCGTPGHFAMNVLKEKLTTAPVLAYPSFGKPYTVETDASISGLGAVLSQIQVDKKLHPVAYASRSLSPAERNYSVTELETLAVVWAQARFHSYLYGQSVTVITDHAAVRAVLETSNPSCKHARWWTQVYGTGLKDVKIVYIAGRLNSCADALSHHPVGTAPVQPEWEDPTQIASVRSTVTSDSESAVENATGLTTLLSQPPAAVSNQD